MIIPKNAACPKCGGVIKRCFGKKDIFIKCIQCGLYLKAIGLTEYDGEFKCEIIHEGGLNYGKCDS